MTGAMSVEARPGRMIRFDFIFNPNVGLGDCLSCFNTTRPIWSPSPHYALLRRLSSVPSLDSPAGAGFNLTALHGFDMGREHFYNRVRLLSGMAPLASPRAMLDLVRYQPDDASIAFSFDVGANVHSQLDQHPRPRMLYPEHRRTIQSFISRNSPRFRFVELGTTSFSFDDVEVRTGIGLAATIEILRRCRSYFGMHSGMMHLATAIGLDCTIVVNFPPPRYLPGAGGALHLTERRQWNWELQWLYPQHRYLHEDATSGALQISTETLQRLLPVCDV